MAYLDGGGAMNAPAPMNEDKIVIPVTGGKIGEALKRLEEMKRRKIGK